MTKLLLQYSYSTCTYYVAHTLPCLKHLAIGWVIEKKRKCSFLENYYTRTFTFSFKEKQFSPNKVLFFLPMIIYFYKSTQFSTKLQHSTLPTSSVRLTMQEAAKAKCNLLWQWCHIFQPRLETSQYLVCVNTSSCFTSKYLQWNLTTTHPSFVGPCLLFCQSATNMRDQPQRLSDPPYLIPYLTACVQLKKIISMLWRHNKIVYRMQTAFL